MQSNEIKSTKKIAYVEIKKYTIIYYRESVEENYVIREKVTQYKSDKIYEERSRKKQGGDQEKQRKQKIWKQPRQETKRSNK